MVNLKENMDEVKEKEKEKSRRSNSSIQQHMSSKSTKTLSLLLDAGNYGGGRSRASSHDISIATFSQSPTGFHSNYSNLIY